MYRVWKKTVMTPLWHLALTVVLKQHHLGISVISSNSYVEINCQVELTEVNVDFSCRNIIPFLELE